MPSMIYQPKLKQLILKCECRSQDHWLVVERDDWNGQPNIAVYTQLHHWAAWYKRLWWAVKYAFGKAQPYGHWDSTLLDRQSAIEMREFLDEYLNDYAVWMASTSHE